MSELEIRADERRRVATLLREEAETFAGAGATKTAVVLLIALMLDIAAPASSAAGGADGGAGRG